MAHAYVYHRIIIYKNNELTCKRLNLDAKFVLSRVVSKLQLEDELLKKGGSNVMGLMGWIGKPIRVRLEIRLDPLLGIKLASPYKEGTCTS
jgi:hypothetical protein